MSRPVVYPLRPIDTATVRFTAASHHRRRVTIDHRPLANVTPAMLLDWFSNIRGTTYYGARSSTGWRSSMRRATGWSSGSPA